MMEIGKSINVRELINILMQTGNTGLDVVFERLHDEIDIAVQHEVVQEVVFGMYKEKQVVVIRIGSE